MPQATSPRPADPQAAVGAGPIRMAAPGPGERLSAPVVPGQLVALPDEIFAPGDTSYRIEGANLVVTLADGGVIVLVGFFAHPDDAPQLSIGGGPAVSAADLLEQLGDAAPSVTALAAQGNLEAVQPAAGPNQPLDAAEHGGGASFRRYQASETDGAPTSSGPLGADPPVARVPTEVAEPPALPEIDADTDDGSANLAPVVEIPGAITGLVAVGSSGFPWPSSAPAPALVPGRPLPDAQINGVDPANLTVDRAREVTVVFDGQRSVTSDSLGLFTLAADGTVGDVALLFAEAGAGTPLTPGDSIATGELAAGTRLGLFLVQDGAALNPREVLEDGRLELRGADGAPFRPGDGGVPALVTVAPDGSVRDVAGAVFLSLDGDGGAASANPSNPDGLGHVVSWLDAGSGDLVVAFENAAGPGGDFADLQVRIRYGAVQDGRYDFAEDTVLPVAIGDDGTLLAGAEIALTDGIRPGDRLELAGFDDGDGDGVLDGTGITLRYENDVQMVLSGADTVERYEALLGAVRLTGDGSVATGQRALSLTVTDADGVISDTTTSTIDVAPLMTGTGAGEALVGGDENEAFAAAAGDDEVLGGGGRDVIDGGEGDDRLFGDDGDDLIIGGPGRDRLSGGAGADVFEIRTLGDGADTILDFDATAGDRLDLTALIGAGFDPADDPAPWLRIRGAPVAGRLVVEVDVDGAAEAHGFAGMVNLIDPAGVGADPLTITTWRASDGATG